ncbi:hypothetical protein LTR67_011312 [Exophiala xenobiotica]
MKTMRGTPSNMAATLEEHELEQLLQLGGKHTGKRKPIYEELGLKYGLTHRQLHSIYTKEKKKQVRGHENDPPSVQMNASPTMENSPEQDDAKIVLHEDSIRDPASHKSKTLSTQPSQKQEDMNYTQSNADFPHGPVPELDGDLKDLSTVPATTPNIKQESLDHAQSGEYSPYEPVPKLESGLADYVRMDIPGGVQDFPGQMSSMPSQKHEDIKASLDDTIECSLGVSQPLTGHDGGVTCEDGIQKRKGSAFLGPGQPVSTYPEDLLESRS